jgi:hypothetical protein
LEKIKMELKKEHLLHPKNEAEGIKLKEEMADCLMRPRQPEWNSTIGSLTGAFFAIAIGATLLSSMTKSLQDNKII